MVTSIQLRNYQQEAIEAVEREFASGIRRTLLVLPTGAGKTIVFASAMKPLVQAGRRVLVLAHTEELIDQAARTLRRMLPDLDEKDIGIVRARRDEADAQVVVASVQTLRSPERLQRIGQFDLIVVDEAHHIVAPTYRSILEALGAFDDSRTYPRVLGVTATADRGDGQGLDDIFESIAFEVGIDELIRQGYLADIRAKRVVLDMRLDEVRRRNGDFDDGDLGRAMTNAGTPILIAKAIRQFASGRKCVVFLPTVDLAKLTALALRAAGLQARAVSGKTPKAEREQIINDIREGRLDVVTNAMVLTEGFDAPILDCAVMARPTSSRALYQQSAGRVLRLYPGKQDALILDVVGVTSQHSLHTAASLLDALPPGEEIRETETAMEAVQRVQAVQKQQAEASAPEDGRLVAFDIDLFDRSRLNWVTNASTLLVLSGAKTSHAIRIDPSGDRCELFRLDLDPEGHGYIAERVASDLDLGMAQSMAEDAARQSGLDPTSWRNQAWRHAPATEKQMRKLWKIGVRNRAVLQSVRTKGQAADMITEHLATEAIRQYDLLHGPVGQVA